MLYAISCVLFLWRQVVAVVIILRETIEENIELIRISVQFFYLIVVILNLAMKQINMTQETNFFEKEPANTYIISCPD